MKNSPALLTIVTPNFGFEEIDWLQHHPPLQLPGVDADALA